MSKSVAFEKKDGSGLKIGIVSARWNRQFCEALTQQCKHALRDSGVKEENIIEINVPGAYEVVFGAQSLIKNKKVDAVVCIGVLIKGETMHFEYIAEAVAQGIMNLNLRTGVPIIFGILTCLTEEHAQERSVGDKSHGYNWGLTAVEMGMLKNFG